MWSFRTTHTALIERRRSSPSNSNMSFTERGSVSPGFGRAPIEVAKFLAGGSLVALIKDIPNGPQDIRPIAVGEVLRRLTSKCLCTLTEAKAAEYFEGYQTDVACLGGLR